MNTRAVAATLDHAGIAARIPHHGRMCLLDRLESWTETAIDCRALSHRDADNPLRSAAGLWSVCAIEYAAQAMALHGALCAADSAPRPGCIASVRDVRLGVPRLDEIDGELQVIAERLAGDASQVLYRFELRDARGAVLVDGRAAVVLNTPLAARAKA